MSKIGDALRKLAARKKTTTPKKSLGSVILKPSESSAAKAAQSAGVSTKIVSKTPSSQVSSGNIQRALRSSGGGGRISSSSSASIQRQEQQRKAQEQLSRLAEEARKRDQARQQEIMRIQDQSRKRHLMIIAEQKRQQDLSKLRVAGLPSKNVQSLSDKERKKLERKSFVRKVGQKVSGRLDVIAPPQERGLLGLVSEEPNKGEFITDTTPFASGQGTNISKLNRELYGMGRRCIIFIKKHIPLGNGSQS